MAPSKEQILINKRTSFVNQLARLQEFAENEAAAATLESLEIRMASLERIQIHFEGVHGKLEETHCDEETEKVRTDFENIYFAIHPLLTRLIRDKREATVLVQPAPPAPAVVVNAGRHGIRLPELSVPKFAGDTTKWLSFIESFMSLVDRNAMLNNAAKFQHLQMSVVGPAAKIIESIELNDENYPVALALLRDRYDNRTLIAQEHIKQLFSLKPVEKNSVRDLRDLIDSTKAHVRALQTLERPVHHWDDMIIYLITTKLDFYSLSKWQEEAPTDRFPILTDLLDVLKHRCLVLENTAQSVSPSASKSNANTKSVSQAEKKRTSLVSASPERCIFCDKTKHNIYRCDRFRKLSPFNRLAEIKKLQACINCLRTGHFVQKCPTEFCCRTCSGNHHSLLHFNSDENSSNAAPAEASTSSASTSRGTGNRTEPTNNSSTSCSVTALPTSPSGEFNNDYIFLATAMTIARNQWGQAMPCRVLLDSASQLNFITERLANQLHLTRENTKVELNGVGGIETTTKHMTFLSINSRLNDFSLPIEVYILPQITGSQPDRFIDVEKVGIPEKMPLADPKFNCPQRIDLLIGSEYFFSLLRTGQFSPIDDPILLQNTVFGWIVSGRTASIRKTTHEKISSCCVASHTLVPLDKQVQQFWELEEASKILPTLSDEESECLQHFHQNVSRTEKGRYVVRLPFRRSPSVLGNSQSIATQRFLNLERKFFKQPELKLEYSAFIHDYLQLGHMELVDAAMLPENNYFMPHHCVLKPDSSSTRLRVVFDASAKSGSGNSLNDLLMVGPTVQSDIFSILLRFRFWRYVFITDIAKMYRQILVAAEDTNFQCIVWRDEPDEELRIYRLKTITYGTSAAPFLATQTLNQLASDYADDYPNASQIVRRDCYVDDIMTGCNSLQDVIRLQAQLIALLQRGGFELKKWCANHDSLLNHLPPEDLVPRFRFRDNDAVKTLGLIWEPTSDQFVVAIDSKSSSKRISKRIVLADTMRVFDPLGLVAPVVVSAKIFLQRLWKLNLSWDETLSQELHDQWTSFRNQLCILSEIKFDRHLLLENANDLQLHAFADASEKAFGSAIYVRSSDRYGNIKMALLCSKSRVAPTKSTTLPKLELCAAQLTAELVSRIVECYPIKMVYYWTDSTVTLSWIAAPAYRWKTFVANRVAIIQELSEIDRWSHIRSEENPADLTSRGVNPRNLIESDLWFHGPKFLTDGSDWPATSVPMLDDIPEQKVQRVSLVTSNGEKDLIANIKFNDSFQMTVRVVAYCQRFVNKIRARLSKTPLDLPSTFNADQFDTAIIACVRCIQQNHFAQELADLSKNSQVKCRSAIHSLNPFLDKQQVIRVGGRLQLAEIPYSAKHQIILPKSHPFTAAMINHYHRKHFHAGPQSLLAAVRQTFWPIHGKELVKKIVRKCVRCARTQPLLCKQLMGSLPYDRLNPERPFTNVGIDFMGPFHVHYRVRGKRPTKAYAAIFICFWSRAVHIEVVSDLTSDAFLAALKRFVGRRGLPRNIYTDNATNFVGASNDLRELKELFLKQSTQTEITSMCANDGINWCTIPPRSPHFGGLWEAAVKAAKFHLKRQFALASLTFEELATCMVQIEAILNSRPLVPLSTSPDDFEALTAGHFLVGGPLTAPLEPNVADKNIGILKRWHRIAWLQQQFWQWWVKEYIHQLQDRQKWTQVSQNLKINSFVLLQDDNLPPLKWLMGRVVELHPGKDNLVRVATVRTATGTFKRAITRLALLPIVTTDSEN